MKQGDLILVSVPQADGKAKNRPALLLREMPPPYRYALVCGVSTQLHHFIAGFDEIVSPADEDFVQSGLLAESLIRLGFLAIVPRSQIPGAIDSTSPERHRRLLKPLSEYLILPTDT